jgi:hypothetical protein
MKNTVSVLNMYKSFSFSSVPKQDSIITIYMIFRLY